MDTGTLLNANVLLLLLCAGAVFVSARIFGGSRAAVWFSGGMLVWSAALGSRMIARPFHAGAREAIGTTLLIASMVMVHRSFTELLDRGKLLWRLQRVLLLVGGLASLAVWHLQPAYPVEQLLGSAILGVQAALVASAVFSFSGDGVEAAGWFTGAALSLYAVLHLMRVAVTLRYGSSDYARAARDMDVIWLSGMLLASCAATFGFLLIATGKLRLELLWRAQIDELTGLLNRWAFKRIAVKETFRSMRLRGRLATISMDLDGMKRVNDRLGHGAGDAVLQAVAMTLQEALRDRDSIARMGGDEFCILLPDTEMQEALTVAERLRSQVEALPIRYRGETIHVGASFGVSSSNECGWNWQNLLDASDAALYEAKRGGHNQVVAATGKSPDPGLLPETSIHAVVNDRRRRG